MSGPSMSMNTNMPNLPSISPAMPGMNGMQGMQNTMLSPMNSMVGRPGLANRRKPSWKAGLTRSEVQNIQVSLCVCVFF